MTHSLLEKLRYLRDNDILSDLKQKQSHLGLLCEQYPKYKNEIYSFFENEITLDTTVIHKVMKVEKYRKLLHPATARSIGYACDRYGKGGIFSKDRIGSLVVTFDKYRKFIDSFEDWKKYLLLEHGDRIDVSAALLKDLRFEDVSNGGLNQAVKSESDENVDAWVSNFLCVNTLKGLLIQEEVLEFLAKKFGYKYIRSTSQEDSKFIDGKFDNLKISVKPFSFTESIQVNQLNESEVDVVIYYKEKNSVVEINFTELMEVRKRHENNSKS